MATGDRETVSFTTDAGTAAEIEAYKGRSSSADNRSKAIEELVQIGLREQRGPLLYRWRDSAADVALMFCAAAVSVVVIGMGTPMLTLSEAVQVGAAFALVALGLVGAIEVARTVNGQSELSALLRRVRQ